MLPTLARHPRKHATHGTHARTNSTPFFKLPQNYPHLKNVRIADSFDEQLMNIYVLIGIDFYSTFFTVEIIRVSLMNQLR